MGQINTSILLKLDLSYFYYHDCMHLNYLSNLNQKDELVVIVKVWLRLAENKSHKIHNIYLSFSPDSTKSRLTDVLILSVSDIVWIKLITRGNSCYCSYSNLRERKWKENRQKENMGILCLYHSAKPHMTKRVNIKHQLKLNSWSNYQKI